MFQKRVYCFTFLHMEPSDQIVSGSSIVNTYSMKQPDLYYFETIKMTSQA